MPISSYPELSAMPLVEQWCVHDEESRLPESCLRSDRESQRQLYAQYCKKVYRLMFRMVGASHAEDLTQQVFLRVFQNLEKFHGRCLFSTWLFRVASNEALQFLRRNQRNLERPMYFELADNRSSAIDQIDQQEQMEHTLKRLDPALRVVFLLREGEGLSYYDIAMALDIAEGTVASRLNRARRCLRELTAVDAK